MTSDKQQKIRESWNEIFSLKELNGIKSDTVADWWLSILDKELEEELKKMGEAIEMSKQGWIDQGKEEDRKRIVKEIERLKIPGVYVVDYNKVIDLIHNKS